MSDPTAEFFVALAEHGHDAVPEKATGTLRFEIVEGGRTRRWYVTVERGDVDVSQKNAPADATVRAPKDLFDGIAAGKVNPMAAILRGSMVVEGDSVLLVLFQRLFPGPPSAARKP
jgi:putative sterol carrier protein